VFASEVSTGLVNRVAEDGQLVPLTRDLSAGSDGASVGNVAGARVVLGGSASKELVRLEQPGGAIGFALEGSAPGVRAKADGSVVRHEGVLAGVDVELELLPAGVKETLVLSGPGVPRRFVFPLDTPLRPAIEGGAVVFRDADGVVQAMMPPGWMEDANPDVAARVAGRSEGVRYELVGGPETGEKARGGAVGGVVG